MFISLRPLLIGGFLREEVAGGGNLLELSEDVLHVAPHGPDVVPDTGRLGQAQFSMEGLVGEHLGVEVVVAIAHDTGAEVFLGSVTEDFLVRIVGVRIESAVREDDSMGFFGVGVEGASGEASEVEAAILKALSL